MTWILLVITFGSGPDDTATLPYRDAFECGRAIPTLRDLLDPEYPDLMIQCRDTGQPITRPKARPWGDPQGPTLPQEVTSK